MRYTAAGVRDRSFGTNGAIRNVGRCDQVVFNDGRTGTNRNMRANVSRNRNAKAVTAAIGNAPSRNLIFFNSTVRRTYHMIWAFDETGRNCRLAMDVPTMGTVRAFDIKTIGGTPYLFALGNGPNRRQGAFTSCNLTSLMCNSQIFPRGGFSNLLLSFSRMSVNNEGTLVYLANGNLQAYPLTRGGNAFSISETRQRYCARPNNPDISSQLMNVSSVAVSPDDSNIVYIGSAYNFGIQKLQVSDTGCTVLTHIGKGVRSFDKNGGDDVTTIAANDVNFSQVWGLEINSAGTRILTSTEYGFC